MTDTTDTKAAADALDGIEPSAWQTKAKDSTTWIHCTEGVAEWMAGSPSAFSHYELRALYDRAAIEAAIERARAEAIEQAAQAAHDHLTKMRSPHGPSVAQAIRALGTTMINGLTRAETDASASCAGLSAGTTGEHHD